MLPIQVASVFFASDSGSSPVSAVEVLRWGVIYSNLRLHSATVESRPVCLAMRAWIFVTNVLRKSATLTPGVVGFAAFD